LTIGQVRPKNASHPKTWSQTKRSWTLIAVSATDNSRSKTTFPGRA